MDSITAPLREEHRELLPRIEDLRRVADAVGILPIPALRERVSEIRRFLSSHLIPHAVAEDSAMYPVVARVMGAPEATATMRHDHVEVAELVAQLEGVEPELTGSRLPMETERALRRILYGLYTLVRVHFVEEEEIYLPLLDANLSPEEAHGMFEQMEATAARARAGV
ncbi:MAG TPA: hemerythrin domain-containing protein [Actinomycetota bacterium]|nr:hemerythrin domain-containing protein [Actinomycetota bacterium]